MAYTRRGFKGGAKKTTVSGTLSAGALSVPCSDVSTWVGVTTNGPATATISLGETDEETITFTGISVNTLTGVTRGAAGTTAQEHGSGAKIEHTSSFTDVDEANEHLSATSGASLAGHDTRYARLASTNTFTQTQTIANLILSAATVAATATAGAATLPAAPAGFLALSVNGSTIKLPYYSA